MYTDGWEMQDSSRSRTGGFRLNSTLRVASADAHHALRVFLPSCDSAHLDAHLVVLTPRQFNISLAAKQNGTWNSELIQKPPRILDWHVGWNKKALEVEQVTRARIERATSASSFQQEESKTRSSCGPSATGITCFGHGYAAKFTVNGEHLPLRREKRGNDEQRRAAGDVTLNRVREGSPCRIMEGRPEAPGMHRKDRFLTGTGLEPESNRRLPLETVTLNIEVKRTRTMRLESLFPALVPSTSPPCKLRKSGVKLQHWQMNEFAIERQLLNFPRDVNAMRAAQAARGTVYGASKPKPFPPKEKRYSQQGRTGKDSNRGRTGGLRLKLSRLTT
ncbi:hypothetical protein C8F04DRAFT_1187692 [Mycena alexandri]|uniref:Uncharacterized protein n=1 Tax=Mycena alexandri TaxID=1745969 RepID=A0AAD6WYM5_9AGAR|nr:hypothetical protein C8F04DRAFT_1187692 [Mycena alexandri]